MPQTRARVVGSNYTTLNWNGRPIAWLDSFLDNGQNPIAPPESLQPLGARYPVEFATARSMGAGTLTFNVVELWDTEVWRNFGPSAGSFDQINDIIDVWDVLAANPTAVTCQLIIKPPAPYLWRVVTYHNVTLSAIDDGENVNNAALSITRPVTAMYARKTRSRVAAGSAVVSPPPSAIGG